MRLRLAVVPGSLPSAAVGTTASRVATAASSRVGAVSPAAAAAAASSVHDVSDMLAFLTRSLPGCSRDALLVEVSVLLTPIINADA